MHTGLEIIILIRLSTFVTGLEKMSGQPCNAYHPRGVVTPRSSVKRIKCLTSPTMTHSTAINSSTSPRGKMGRKKVKENYNALSVILKTLWVLEKKFIFIIDIYVQQVNVVYIHSICFKFLYWLHCSRSYTKWREGPRISRYLQRFRGGFETGIVPKENSSQ